MISIKKIPLEGWVMIFILFGYAQNELWPFFSKENIPHTFFNGTEYTMSDQYFVKGFTDLFLQAIKAGCISLLMKKYCINIAWFFYILCAYATANLILYWYNFCQSPVLFYIMWGCLAVSAYMLWPKIFKIHVLK